MLPLGSHFRVSLVDVRVDIGGTDGESLDKPVDFLHQHYEEVHVLRVRARPNGGHRVILWDGGDVQKVLHISARGNTHMHVHWLANDIAHIVLLPRTLLLCLGDTFLRVFNATRKPREYQAERNIFILVALDHIAELHLIVITGVNDHATCHVHTVVGDLQRLLVAQLSARSVHLVQVERSARGFAVLRGSVQVLLIHFSSLLIELLHNLQHQVQVSVNMAQSNVLVFPENWVARAMSVLQQPVAVTIYVHRGLRCQNNIAKLVEIFRLCLFLLFLHNW